MKAEKFKELAEKRVVKTLKQVRLIGNLANRSSYEYTDDQVDKIFQRLQAELSQAKSRFAGRSARSEEEFRL